MTNLLIIFILSFVVEAIVEYGGQRLAGETKRLAAAGVAILLCLAYGADVLALLGYPALFPYVGSVLTGLLIGRGSNAINGLNNYVSSLSGRAGNATIVFNAAEPIDDGQTTVMPL